MPWYTKGWLTGTGILAVICAVAWLTRSGASLVRGLPPVVVGRRRHLAAAALSIALTLAPAFGITPACARAGDPEPELPAALSEFSVHRIGGATLYFKRVPGAAKGAIAALMQAGTGDQKPDEAHCAHMAEHMVFNYPLRGAISLAYLIHNSGETTANYYNGYTGLDSTEFWMTAPNPALPSILTAFLDSLFAHSIAGDSRYEAEIKRSSRELSFMTTNEFSATLNRMRLNLLQGTPYDEKLFETRLSTVKPERITELMKREYSPDRLTLVVLGDCDEQGVVKAVESGVANVPGGQKPVSRQVTLAPPESGILKLPSVQKPLVSVGVGISGILEDDRSALLVLWNLASVRLRAMEVDGLEFEPMLFSVFPMRAASAAMFGFVSTTGGNEKDLQAKGAAAVRAVQDVLAGLARSGLEASDLEARPVGADSDVAKTMEQVMSTIPETLIDASSILNLLVPEIAPPGDAVLLSGGTQPDDAYIARLNSVAAKYMTGGKVTVLYTVYGVSLTGILVVAGIGVVVAVTVIFVILRRRAAHTL